MGIRVQSSPFDPGEELAAFSVHNTGVGAVVSCLGVVRAISQDDQDITALALEHYPGFTEREIGRIEAKARERFAVVDVVIIHRFGQLAPGEPIVFVAAAAAHRRAAFDSCDYIMDRLKTEAPFWKKEHTKADAHWVEPRKTDHTDRARWETHPSGPAISRKD